MEQPCNFQQCVHIRMSNCQQTSGNYGCCRYQALTQRIEELEKQISGKNDAGLKAISIMAKLDSKLKATTAVVDAATKLCNMFDKQGYISSTDLNPLADAVVKYNKEHNEH